MSSSHRVLTRNMVERVAIELRHMDDQEAAYPKPPRKVGCTWDRISDVLRDGYRDDARRVLRVVDYELSHPTPTPGP